MSMHLPQYRNVVLPPLQYNQVSPSLPTKPLQTLKKEREKGIRGMVITKSSSFLDRDVVLSQQKEQLILRISKKAEELQSLLAFTRDLFPNLPHLDEFTANLHKYVSLLTTEQANEPFIYKLPSYLSLKIFSLLDIESLIAAEQVCKSWNLFLRSRVHQNYLWKKLFRIRFRRVPVDVREKDWKAKYREEFTGIQNRAIMRSKSVGSII